MSRTPALKVLSANNNHKIPHVPVANCLMKHNSACVLNDT